MKQTHFLKNPLDKSKRLTDQQSGFNNLPITKRLSIRTGVTWKRIEVTRTGAVVYAPARGVPNPKGVRIINTGRSWLLVVQHKVIIRCLTLKPLYPYIRNALEA